MNTCTHCLKTHTSYLCTDPYVQHSNNLAIRLLWWTANLPWGTHVWDYICKLQTFLRFTTWNHYPTYHVSYISLRHVTSAWDHSLWKCKEPMRPWLCSMLLFFFQAWWKKWFLWYQTHILHRKAPWQKNKSDWICQLIACIIQEQLLYRFLAKLAM